jgi:hypothetical protein
MFGLTDKLIAIAAGIGCLVLTGLLLIQTGALHKAERRADKAEVALATEREAWADERANAATALAFATAQAREKEQALAAAAHQSEEIKNAEIATLAARTADLRRRLRNAEASAATSRLVSGAAAASAAGQVAGERDRPEFSGSLGYDVVSEAERADQIRFQLAACERQYESARAALK